MADEFLTPGRTASLRRLLVVVLVFAGVMVVASVPLIAGDYVRFGVIVLGLGLCLGATAWRARVAVGAQAPSARRLAILTGVLTLLFSVPLMGLFYVGLLTAVTGVGLLFTVLAPEKETP